MLQAGAIVFVLVLVSQAKLGVGGEGGGLRLNEGLITSGRSQGISPASWQDASQASPEGGLPSTRPCSSVSRIFNEKIRRALTKSLI